MAMATFLVGCVPPPKEVLIADSMVTHGEISVAWFLRETFATDAKVFVLKYRGDGMSDWVSAGLFQRFKLRGDKEVPRLKILNDMVVIRYVSAEVFKFSNRGSVRVNGEWRDIWFMLHDERIETRTDLD